MTNTEILLIVLVVALGVYATFQHATISRYRAWSLKAQEQLISAVILMAEYEAKESESEDDSE